MPMNAHRIPTLALSALFAAGFAAAGCQSPIAGDRELAEVPTEAVASAAADMADGECIEEVRLPGTLSIDKGAGGFVGVWVGKWRSEDDPDASEPDAFELCSVLVVEAVSEDRAAVVYSWGRYVKFNPGSQHLRGELSGDKKLTVYLKRNFGNVTYDLVDADTLDGRYYSGGGTAIGTFHRVPLS